MTMLLTASIIVFGILTYNQLAVNDLPAVDYPVIQVSASYPGANPETMANSIATPLEKQFTQIPGLELTTSTSSQGNTQSPCNSLSQRDRRGRDRRAVGHSTRHRPVADRSSPARPLSPSPIRTINQSCMSP